MEYRPNTLCKAERLSRKKLIDNLFSGGSKSFSLFPLRVVYKQVEPDENTVRASILISVPKKRFKRAVKRNRVKRQIREAYRTNKYLLLDPLEERNKSLLLAFIWISDNLCTTTEVKAKIKKLLLHITENIK